MNDIDKVCEAMRGKWYVVNSVGAPGVALNSKSEAEVERVILCDYEPDNNPHIVCQLAPVGATEDSDGAAEDAKMAWEAAVAIYAGGKAESMGDAVIYARSLLAAFKDSQP